MRSTCDLGHIASNWKFLKLRAERNFPWIVFSKDKKLRKSSFLSKFFVINYLLHQISYEIIGTWLGENNEK